MRIVKRWLALLGSASLLLAGMGNTFAEEPEQAGIPPYELARFSAFERDYSAETENLLYGNTLYANWTRADGLGAEEGVDMETAYPGRENLRLKVTLDLTSSEPTLCPDTAWEQITVKLRSPDVTDKEGDPDLEVNGGHHQTNNEHNYGWEIRPEEVSMQNGHLELSIPLDRPADYTRGCMDWSLVQRIILTMQVRNSVVADGYAPALVMRLSEVRIVNDVMAITRDRIRAVADNAFPEGIVYRQDSLDQFAEARQQALALVADPETPLQRLEEVEMRLRQVRESMVEITYGVAAFSRICGTYPGENAQTLYADWTYADEGGDGFGVDLTHHDFANMMLQIELALQGPEDYDGVWNTDGWVLLRSADEQGRLCTYGWRLSADDPAIGRLHTGVNRLSIPLNASAGDGYTILQSDPTAPRQGAFDWSAVNRLHLYVEPQGYQKGAFSMTITMARIVDLTQPTEDMGTLTQALAQLVKEEAAYMPESWQSYVSARQQAEAVRDAYPYADPRTIREAAEALTQATKTLVEVPPYTPGDVDGDGDITIIDALLALQIAAETITPDLAGALAADVDGTPGVSASDALLILQCATGRMFRFPVEDR